MLEMSRKKTNSGNFCIVCGKSTSKFRMFGSAWISYFFICNNCQKVWCVDCMGGLTGKGARKTFRLGKKGNIKCPECRSKISMVYRPKNIPFTQGKPQISVPTQSQQMQQSQQQQQQQQVIVNIQQLGQPQPQTIEQIEMKFCSLCGKKIKKDATFCEYCGSQI
nr:MAG: Zn finger protein [uncultured archaeon]